MKLFTLLKSMSAGLLLFTLQASLFAQEQPLSQETSAVEQYFSRFYRADPRLVSGNYYRTPMMSEGTGDPFCIDANWKTGSVVIDGIRFEELPLRYDITSHELILNTVDQTDTYMQIMLKKTHISEFTMNGRLFIPFHSDDPLLGRRFCELMVDGQVSLLVLRTKNLKVTAGGVNDFYYQLTRLMYLQIGETLLPYRGKNSLYKAFPEQAPALKAFAKENRLRFRKLDEWDHSRMITYCNTLLSQYEK